MAIFKCKMCGGDLEIDQGIGVAECEFCGTKQTLPKVSDDNIRNLFNRANNLRIKCEFDKAEQLYEKILQESDAEAEAHWGIVLCKYGIEYVEDPKTYKHIPTCHRASYDAVTTDAEYLAAIKYADPTQKAIYEAEAAAIDRIQRGILDIVKNEQPFDVFICYKQTDEHGNRTPDSVIANDIYHQLTREGLKVFYAAITLEKKLGQAYEPYIFAALNSAKVMLVIGTKPEHFSAVWVKNEWSRYLKAMKAAPSRLLIPCYKDMDAYDLPGEFSHLQAQDMNKIGFVNDVIWGIKKVTAKEQPVVTLQEQAAPAATNTAPLLERAFMFLEDGEWQKADDFCEQVLNQDPKCATAYLGKLMAELKVRKQAALKEQPLPFDQNNNYQKALRFADGALKAELVGYIDHIKNRNYHTRLEGTYSKALMSLSTARTEQQYKEAAMLFRQVLEYKDAAELARQCDQKAEEERKDDIYSIAKIKLNSSDASEIAKAQKFFESIPDWMDSAKLAQDCKQKIEQLNTEKEAARKEAERLAKKRKKIALIAAAAACVVIALIMILNTLIIPSTKYKEAMSLKDTDPRQALALFMEAKNIKDAEQQIKTLLTELTQRDVIAAGYKHTVGLQPDGTVVAAGSNHYGQCNVDDWTDIVAVSAGGSFTVGLKTNGTMVATGYNAYGQCNIGGWTDIVAVSAGDAFTVGLKADGTVVAVGMNGVSQCNVGDWTDIIAISAGGYHTVGLKADGTVVAVGSNHYDQCDVDNWTDIVAVTAGDNHTVGLKADGTVVAAGDNGYKQCNVDRWTNIVAVSAGAYHTVGLKADGTVVAVGFNGNDRCNVGDWTDVVAVAAGLAHTVGLRADGTVVAVGTTGDGRCDVDEWEDLLVPEK